MSNTTVAISFVNPATGEPSAAVAPTEFAGHNAVFPIALNGMDIGELRVYQDRDGRPTIALGQFDRRVNDWRAQTSITRRGAWIEANDGVHQVLFDGRPIPGLPSYATHDEASTALSVVEALK